MKLYRLDTYGLKSFFVVANDPTEAEEHLIKLLNESDYGFSKDRKVNSINLLSSEVTVFGGKPKPHFTDDNRLILPQSCTGCL